jgi:hypothetical protein
VFVVFSVWTELLHWLQLQPRCFPLDRPHLFARCHCSSVYLRALVDHRRFEPVWANSLLHSCNPFLNFDLRRMLQLGRQCDSRMFEVRQLEEHRADDLQGPWEDNQMERQLWLLWATHGLRLCCEEASWRLACFPMENNIVFVVNCYSRLRHCRSAS